MRSNGDGYVELAIGQHQVLSEASSLNVDSIMEDEMDEDELRKIEHKNQDEFFPMNASSGQLSIEESGTPISQLERQKS